MSRFSVAPIALVWAAMLAIAPAHAAMNDDARRDAADKIDGRRLYQTECASCHGPAGAGDGAARGTAKVPDFTTPQAVVKFDLDRMLAGIDAKHDKALTAAWKAKFSDTDSRKVTAFMREAFMLPAPTADATRGRAIFAKTCAVCHGERGNGASWAKGSLNPSPFDFTSAKAKELSRRHMINTVTYGSPKTAMMAFSIQLSRQDIAAVVDYIRETFVFPQGNLENENAASEAPKSGNMTQPKTGQKYGPADMSAAMPNGLVGDAAAGKRFFNSNCFTCHGKDGKGDGPRAYFIQPKPANLTSDESRAEMNRPRLFKSIYMGVNGSEMPAWSKVLSDQEVANVAEYVYTAFIQPAKAPASAGPEQKKNRR
ncbi:MAG: c-type cytochrome [Rhodospirillaceae bacterium]|nr:c-type cytochrome [Rhodospirillales bacterium]